MLNDLLNYIANEDIKSEENCKIFLVLDTDLNKTRINEIKEIEEKCNKNNIEIITSSPTFEIWYLMHYRSNKLNFLSSKEVKKELAIINNGYEESMDMYKLIYNLTDKAKTKAKSIEQSVINNKEELLKTNFHTSIYKILDAIDKFENDY